MSIERKTFDVTSTMALLLPVTNYKYYIYGIEIDNNRGSCFADRTKCEFVTVSPTVSIYGVYQSGAFHMSMGACRSLPLDKNIVIATVPEGDYLFIDDMNGRVSGIVYYEKISTVTTTRRIFIT